MRNLLLIAMALFTLNAATQEQKTKRLNRTADSEMMKQRTPNERAGLQTKRLTLKLDLSDAQQEKVNAIILKQATANENNRKAWQTSNADDNAKLSKDEVLKMRNERLDQKIEMKRAMKAILSAEQYEKFEKIQSMHLNKRSKRNGRFQKRG